MSAQYELGLQLAVEKIISEEERYFRHLRPLIENMPNGPLLDIRSGTLEADFIKGHPLGTLVTTYRNRPVATYLPFLMNESSGQLKLYSYLPKANTQWKYLEFEEVLVIFQGPENTGQKQALLGSSIMTPSKYQSLHTYGNCKIVHDEKSVYDILDQMVKKFELTYCDKWDSSSSDVKENISSGLVAFELRINDLKWHELECQKQGMQELYS